MLAEVSAFQHSSINIILRIPFNLLILLMKCFHDDNGHNREQNLVVADIVQLKHDKTFVEQIQLLVRVQQKIIFATFIIGFEYVQEIIHVKILFTDIF